MKNVNDLRTTLAGVFRDLQNKEIKFKDADSLANIAGKMINSARAQLEYYKLRRETPQIEFLEELPHGKD